MLSHFIMIFLLIAPASSVYAQTLEQPAQYISQVDQNLSIGKIAIFPVTDNLDGIYARPLESELTSIIKKNHKWDYVEASFSQVPNIGDLEDSPTEFAKVTGGIDADAFVACRVSKGPGGTSIKLDLFLKSDHLLLAQEVLKDYPRFEINDLKEKLRELYQKLLTKIPYNGQILSRQNNRVTINLGKADGISKDQVLSVIQIIKVTRHPKFHFLISSEKEILGKIKVLKVDDNLSFGSIITEKEKGAIKTSAKISGIDFVNYAVPDDLGGSTEKQDSISDRSDANVSFGKAPGEWLPVQEPMFGEVSLKLGLGTFSESLNLTNSNSALSPGNLGSKASVFPSLDLSGEIWLNPNWQVRAEIMQGVLSTDNPRSGSSPGTLNDSLSYYSLAIGYNFLLRKDFFGPKLRLDLGFMDYRMYVDTSQPEAFTTVNYSGFLLGVTGSLPVDDRKEYYIGATLNLVLFPTLTEQPEASGSGPNNSINSFSVFGEKKIRENIRLTGSLDFWLLSTSFSGPGSRANGEYSTSLSQKISTLNVGISYLF